ncbi:MAG TPA: transglycosylase domain-containing protein [Longimicrobiales bacterium]|nr:transglycosylase domain-containing protein [Longimicrobiales bacterium]
MVRLIASLALAAVGAAWFYFLALPWPVTLRSRNPERTAMMAYRLERAAARGETLEIRHQWVPLDQISRHLRRAVIVAEDSRFYEHAGVDWAALREEVRYTGDEEFSWTDREDLKALLEAVRYYRENRDKIRGRSTITQQVAKNLYFGPERSIVRKFEEFLVARRLERFLSKDRILEIYLNVAEWGPGIFGAEAAAQTYFGRSAASLTLEQAAALAATLPHPLTSNPSHRPGRMRWRQELILTRMGATPAQPQPAPLAIEPPEPELLGVPIPDPTPIVPVVDPVRPDTTPPDTAATGVQPG